MNALNRRMFLRGTGLVGMTFLGCARRTSSDQPNVLLIMTDQQTDEAMSCTGNPHLDTPAMDRIAARGVRFTRSYVTQPLCLPCRSSIQTGRYPHEIGTPTNGTTPNRAYPMLGKLMQTVGYDTAYFGKWHVGTSLEEAGYAVTASSRSDTDTAGRTVEYLSAPRDKPFFVTASFLNPHDVCQLARRQDLPQGPIPQPPDNPSELPPLPENFEIPESEPTAIRMIQAKNRDRHYPTAEWTDLDWRQYLWGYYRLVEKVDREIGTVLAGLRDAGHESNTIVIFTSDHGEGVASHHWNQKQVLYEQAVRVPLVIAHPLASKPGTTSDALVSTGIDLMPTILGAAGAESSPGSGYGRSVEPLARGSSKTWDRRYVVAETTFGRGAQDDGVSGRMLRTERFKYVVYNTGSRREQLFDLNEDPGEMNNLVNEPDYQSELREHRRLISDWASRTNDDFPLVTAS